MARKKKEAMLLYVSVLVNTDVRGDGFRLRRVYAVGFRLIRGFVLSGEEPQNYELSLTF